MPLASAGKLGPLSDHYRCCTPVAAGGGAGGGCTLMCSAPKLVVSHTSFRNGRLVVGFVVSPRR